MGAKRQGRPRRERRRLRYRPGGPRRRYDRAPARRRFAWWDPVGVPLAVAMGGVLVLIGAGVDLAQISGATGRPKLSVTVEQCDTHGSARSRTTDCETRPDASGATLTVRDVRYEVPAGTVLTVRCDGLDCAEADGAEFVLDGVMSAVGLGLVAWAVALRRMRAPGRGLPPI